MFQCQGFIVLVFYADVYFINNGLHIFMPLVHFTVLHSCDFFTAAVILLYRRKLYFA